MDHELKKQMETIYATTPPESIPWNQDAMPAVLDRLILSGSLKPCRALDIGCGTGNHAIRLSILGFDMTGIDISSSAISMAQVKVKRLVSRQIGKGNSNHEDGIWSSNRGKAKWSSNLLKGKWSSDQGKGMCTFEIADMLDDPIVLRKRLGTFDFSYDHEVLHHIFPENREQYVGNVSSLLEKGGRHLSVCFSEDDDHFPGEGKIRTTRMGTRLYLSSEEEISELFGKHFRILDLRTITVPGLRGDHRAVYCFMES